MSETPVMSCPSGGTFYACGDGSKFTGCCGSNPCTVGCPAGWLEPTSFDTSQYGVFADQQCSTGLFYTCNFTSPPFWGCCSSSACASTSGCASTSLAGAFLTSNAALAEPFLSLNTTWKSSDTGGTNGTASSGDNTDSTHHGPNIGALAGGVVGGIVGLAVIVFALLWLHRRRRKQKMAAAAAAGAAADAEDRAEAWYKPQIQELSHDASTAVGLKELPTNWPSALLPTTPSYNNSPEFQNGEWSPQPPSYLTNEPRAKSQHISHELPGSQAGVEMDTPVERVSTERKSLNGSTNSGT